MDELQQDQIIDTFLDELPQEPLPPFFMARLMQQVIAPVYVPEKFRLTIFEFIIPAFATLFLVALYWLSQLDINWTLANLPQIASLRVITVDQSWLNLGIAFALGELVILLAVAWLWLEDRPTISLDY